MRIVTAIEDNTRGLEVWRLPAGWLSATTVFPRVWWSLRGLHPPWFKGPVTSADENEWETAEWVGLGDVVQFSLCREGSGVFNKIPLPPMEELWRQRMFFLYSNTFLSLGRVMFLSLPLFRIEEIKLCCDGKKVLIIYWYMNLNISPSLRAAVTKQQKERESAGGRKPERDRGKNRCGVLSTLWMRDGLYHLFTTVAWVPQEVKFKSSVNRPGITLTTVWPGWDCTPRHWVSFIYLMPACCMKNVSREGTNSPVPKQKLKFEI